MKYSNVMMAINLLSKFYTQCDLPIYATNLQHTDIFNPAERNRVKKHIKEVTELFEKALEEIEELEKEE